MEKLVYVLWGDGTPDSGDIIRDALITSTVPRLHRFGGHGVTVNVQDSDAAEAPSPVPVPAGEDPHIAEVCVWLDSYDRRAGVDEAIASAGLRYAGYLVAEPVTAARHQSTGSWRRRGRRLSTLPIRCCSSTPRATVTCLPGTST
jgi:hypothetical protein